MKKLYHNYYEIEDEWENEIEEEGLDEGLVDMDIAVEDDLEVEGEEDTEDTEEEVDVILEKALKKINIEEEIDTPSTIFQQIEEFCKLRDQFLTAAGLKEYMNKKVKRYSTRLVDIIHIYSELERKDIDEINRRINFGNMNANGQTLISYDSIDIAQELTQKMNSLIETFYEYFQKHGIFAKFATIFSAYTKNKEEAYHEAISCFGEAIYNILIKIDYTKKPLSYCYLWLKTKLHRYFKKSIVGAKVPIANVFSFDAHDFGNGDEDKLGLHQRIGYMPDFDEEIDRKYLPNISILSENKKEDSEITRSKLRESIFYNNCFYGKISKRRKNNHNKNNKNFNINNKQNKIFNNNININTINY